MTEPVAMTTERESRRLPEIDGLRTVSFVFIVIGHAIAVLAVMEHRPIDMAVGGVVLALTRFALPAFMVISSALIASAVQRGSHAMRLKRLLIPYVIWSLVYLSVGQLVSGGQGVSLLDFGRRLVAALVTGTAYYHLWYVVLAVQIAVFAPVVARLLVKVDAKTRWLVVAGVVLANSILLGQVWGPVTDWLPSSLVLFGAGADRNVLFWSAYVVFGIAIGLDRTSFVAWLARMRPVLIPAYVVSASAIAYLVWEQAMRVAGDYAATSEISRVMQPWILPFELLSILFWFSLCAGLTRGRAATMAESVAALSFGGYLIHPLMILLATQVIFQYVFAPTPVMTVAVLSAVGVAGSLILTQALAGISVPLGAALSGMRTRRPD